MEQDTPGMILNEIERKLTLIQRTQTAHTKRFDALDKSVNSVGQDLVRIDERLNELADLDKLRAKVEQMRDIIRTKLGVEV